MTTREVGVRLVVEDPGDFVSALKKAQDAVAGLAKELTSLQAIQSGGKGTAGGNIRQQEVKAVATAERAKVREVEKSQRSMADLVKMWGGRRVAQRLGFFDKLKASLQGVQGLMAKTGAAAEGAATQTASMGSAAGAAGTETATMGAAASTAGASTASMGTAAGVASTETASMGAAATGAGGTLAGLGTAVAAVAAVLVVLVAAIAAWVISIKLAIWYVKLWGKIFKWLAKVIIKAISTAIKIIRGVVKAMQWVVDKVKAAFKLLGNVIKTVLRPILLPVTKLFSYIGDAIKRFANTLLQLPLKAVQAGFALLRERITGAAHAAWEGAVRFQALSIRFEGLVANEIIAAEGAKSLGNALARAQGPADRFLTWAQMMAVTTPFTRRDITETIAFSMAMGFSSAQAKELTTSIGNFVAGMGLGTETMERIILQFGQMKAGGKLFGTELRDLARGAFVPINDVLKRVGENTGMVAEEWRELAATGRTDLAPFFDAFMELVGERFPNAMARMNRTWIAARQNIDDFIREFLGVRLLSPVLETLGGRVQNFLDSITRMPSENAAEVLKYLDKLFPKVKEIGGAAVILEAVGGVFGDVLHAFSETGKALGETLGAALKVFDAFIQRVTGTKNIQLAIIDILAWITVISRRITGALESLARSMGENIGEAARFSIKDALKWGMNIAYALAKGIVVGAAKFLVKAMNFISSLLAKWLGPGSPPLVAPQLPEWGMAALTEWLRGMTLADFSILTDIQGPLEEMLNVIVKMGALAEEQIGPVFANLSRSLIEGFAVGHIDQSVFDAISTSLGEFGDELNILLRRELGLQTAIENVEKAEAKLVATRKAHKDAGLQVRKLTAEYNKLYRAGASEDILRAKLAELNVAEDTEAVLAAQIPIQEEQVDIAQEQQKAAEQLVKEQKALIDQLLKLARMEFGLDADAATSSAKTLAGALGDIEEALDDLGDIGDFAVFEPLIDFGLFETAIEGAEADLDDALEHWGTLMDDWNKEVKPLIEDVGAAFKVLTDQLGITSTATLSEEDKRLARKLGLTEAELAPPVTLIDKIKEAFGKLKTTVGIVGGAISTFIDEHITPLLDALGLTDDSQTLAGRLHISKDEFHNFTVELLGFDLAAWANTQLGAILTKLGVKTDETTLIGRFNALKQAVTDLWEEIKNQMRPVWDHLKDTTWPKILSLGGRVKGFFYALSRLLGVKEVEGQKGLGMILGLVVKAFDLLILALDWIAFNATLIAAGVDAIIHPWSTFQGVLQIIWELMQKIVGYEPPAAPAVPPPYETPDCGVGYHWNGSTCVPNSVVPGVPPSEPSSCPPGQYWSPGRGMCVPYVPSYQTGAWRLPRNELVYAHAEEMILPAHIAKMVRASVAAPSVAAPPVYSSTSHYSTSPSVDIHTVNMNDPLSAAYVNARIRAAFAGGWDY